MIVSLLANNGVVSPWMGHFVPDTAGYVQVSLRMDRWII